MSMMMSLDGFAAGPNDEMDWLPAFDNESMWQDIHDEMWTALDRVDAFVLGRTTYQIWEKYWPAAGKNPQSSESDRRFSKFADAAQKIVLSRTLDKATWNNSLLIKSDIEERLRSIKAQPGKDIAVAGGAGLARSLVGTDLIDDITVIVHPVILGRGKPLFGTTGRRQPLELVRTRRMNSGAVLLQYRRPDEGKR